MERKDCPLHVISRLNSIIPSNLEGALLFLTVALVLLSRYSLQKLLLKKRNYPPGPPSWPIIGSLSYLGTELHISLLNLSKKYGPIMKLDLGARPLIVLSNAELAEELFRVRDADFASRAGRSIQRTAAKYVGFDSEDIAFAEYNPHLRLLRKFCTTELFTAARLTASAKVRKEEITLMIRDISWEAEKGEAVVVREHLHTVTMNIMCQMLFGKRYYGTDIPVTVELKNFKSVIMDVFNVVGKLNLGDLIPLLRWFDLQGIEAEYKRIRPRMEKVLGLIIEEHRQRGVDVSPSANEDDYKDFVDVLIASKGDTKLSDKSIMGVLSDMILGGTDTTATTLEWCLLEAVRNPDMQTRLQTEIDSIVATGRMVEEPDLPLMPYLQAFVKEIFRIHTPVPITLPRLNESASTLGGYDIPSLSTIFVNTYAIAHDPEFWEEPESFNPERFLTSKMSLVGRDFHLAPFGAGRRKCVGITLGITMVQRVFASLLQAFRWSPPLGSTALDVDTSESFCFVLRNRAPLLAAVTTRISLPKHPLQE